MAASTVLDIPYERQSDPASNRMCGAAALCMVYRSLGISCSQAEIAAKLPRLEPYANAGSRTYLLAQDALTRGLSAIVLRAKDPIKTLKTCRDRSLRAILNHRPRPESPDGHFTVLVDIEGENVVVHDPLAGPNIQIPERELLKLWQPLGSTSEITGNVLVVLAKDQESAAPCRRCNSAIPDSLACPGCGQSIPLRPVSALGCLSNFCTERAWEALFCPHCDRLLTHASGVESWGDRGTKPTGAGEAPRQEQNFGSRSSARPGEIDDDPVKIMSLNQEIDKFVALLLSVNKGRPVPGSETYLATIRQLQTEILELHEKQSAERRAKAAQAPAAPPAPAPTPEPVAAQPPARPPVDWNELGRRLVEEIGLRPR